MRYYPIFLDTKDKKMLIVGAGRVALRFLKNFSKSEIEIFVYSKEIKKEFEEYIKSCDTRAFILDRLDEKDYLLYDLVFLATNDKAYNDKIEKILQENKMLYLRADEKSKSSFLTGKVVGDKGVVVLVGTDGKNPYVSRLVGEEISEILTKLDMEKLALLNDIRKKLKKDNKDTSLIKDFIYMEKSELKKYLEEM